MAFCELTGQRPVVGNLVSHSNIKTKHWLQPNVQNKRLYSQALNQMVRLKVSASTLRSVEHRGGLDQFLLKQDPSKLSPRAFALRQKLLKKVKAKA